jgi:hypothetical protein
VLLQAMQACYSVLLLSLWQLLVPVAQLLQQTPPLAAIGCRICLPVHSVINNSGKTGSRTQMHSVAVKVQLKFCQFDARQGM